jgi:hypothetical protein
MLDSQTHPGGVRLFLWNNKRADHAYYQGSIERFQANGSLKKVAIVRSPYNLGSISRFYWGRRIARLENAPTMMVLDDDQNIERDFVGKAVAASADRVALGWWAWKIHGSYWDRSPAGVGEDVDHIGPGGMVFDSRILLDSRFFTDIPDRFGLLDDIWFSYFAKKSGYRLSKLDVEIDFVMHDTNQFHGQADVKPEFYRTLYSEP